MKKLFAFAAFLFALLPIAAVSQPGPPIQPWLQNGSTLSYYGCLTVPATVTGGCKGNGTANFAGIYLNGANAVPVTSVFGRIGAIVSANGDYAFGQISGTAAVTQGGTGLTAGTSGGIPYFSTNLTIASSAALTNHGLVLGGGVAGAPTSLSDLGTTSKVLLGNASGNPTWGQVPNAALVNPATTVNGQTCTLGSTCTVTASATTITVGSTAVASGTSGGILYNSAATLGNSAAITGLVLGAGTSAPTVYTGTSCSNQFPRSLNASGVATCASVALGTDVSGILLGANGGEGVANTGTTFTRSANLTTTGAGATTLAFGASTQTYTFPTTTATIARTDAGQTFTGTQVFGAITATSINGNIWTAGSATLTLGANFTTTGGNSTLALGATGRTYTFPDTSGTIAELGLAQTWLATQTFPSPVFSGTVAGAGTIPNTVLVNSATTVNGQTCTLGSTCTITTSPPNVSTRQDLLSGSSLTYTTPAGARQLYIRMCGGGGGGGGATANSGGTTGSTGGTTSFNSITAIGGAGGSAGGGGVGGTGGTGGTTPNTMRVAGNGGNAGGALLATNPVNFPGGVGGAGPWGGVHYGANAGGAGGDATANTCSGGGGAVSGAGPTNYTASGGGGSGEYVETIINSPAATYTYSVGVLGAGGTGTTQNGGAGGSGRIIVDERYFLERFDAANDNEELQFAMKWQRGWR